MPRRLIQALFALIFLIATAPAAVASPAALTSAPSAPTLFQEEWSEDWTAEGTYIEEAPATEEWAAEGAYVEEAPAVEEPYVQEDFSGFTMPGLTPDNLTETVLGDIDAFWAEEFAANGTAYYAAGTVPVSEVVYSSCGNFGPYDNPAAFCPLEDAVYYSIPLSQDINTTIGDFAWITVLAHEYGHHVQLVLGIEHVNSIDRELQADCFAGAYARRALVNGFLQEGDVTEGVVMNIMGGDPVELDEFAVNAHGSSDYRVTSFMEGYFNGTSVCMTW
jgi:hypothetical protein